MLALSVGILGCGWGSAPILLIPSAWLGCCGWDFVGRDSACKGTTLIFRVVLDFRGIACEGFCLLSLFASQLPSKVANLNVVGLSWFWAGLPPTALGPSVLDNRVRISPIVTHLGLACAQTITCLPKLWSHAHDRRSYYKKVMEGR